MIRHSSTKLVPLKVRHEEQSIETLELDQPGQGEQSKSELDIEIECPRCKDVMELYSKFDEFMYTCESCSLLLKCI